MIGSWRHLSANIPVLVSFCFALIISAFFLRSDYVTLGLSGSGMSVTAKTTAVIRILGPWICAVGAFEAGRLRRSGILLQAPVRRFPRIFYNRFALCVWMFVAGLWVAYAVVRLQSPFRPGPPDLYLLLQTIVVALGYLGLGVIVGRLLPAILASPAALVLAYMAVGLPFASSTAWLRYLTGDVSACCAADQTIDYRASWGACILAISVLAGAIAVCRAVKLWVGSFLMVVVIVCGLLGAGAVLSPLGYAPVAPRAPDFVCRTNQEPRLEVCVWIEQGPMVNDILGSAVAVKRLLAAKGILTPDYADESMDVSQNIPGTYWHFGVPRAESANDLRSDIAGGLVPGPNRLCGSDRAYTDRAQSAAYGLSLELAAIFPRSGEGRAAELGGIHAPPVGVESPALSKWYRSQLDQIELCS